MELKYYAVFVLIVVLPKLLFCLRPQIKTGIFKVVKKHPNVRSCAEKILQKEEYSSGRVHELTGVCEGLNSSVSNKKTYDKGFAYIEQLSFEKKFSPPTQIWFPFEIPDLMYGMTRGKVLSIVSTISEYQNDMIFAGNIVMDGTLISFPSSSFVSSIQLMIGYSHDGIEVKGMISPNVCAVYNMVPLKKARISFKFQTNVSMEVIIDNSTFCRLDIQEGNLGNIKHFIATNEVHSISFG